MSNRLNILLFMRCVYGLCVCVRWMLAHFTLTMLIFSHVGCVCMCVNAIGNASALVLVIYYCKDVTGQR